MLVIPSIAISTVNSNSTVTMPMIWSIPWVRAWTAAAWSRTSTVGRSESAASTARCAWETSTPSATLSRRLASIRSENSPAYVVSEMR